MRSQYFSLILLAFAATSIHAQTPPIVINPETGNEVNLTRAYWNANVDIANRTLTCEWVHSRSALTYDHNPLPASTPSINNALVFRDGLQSNRPWGLFDLSRAWGVSDGIYSGPMPLHLSPFVEEIAYKSDSINAVRVWNDRFGSFICFDASGQPLLPTGFAGTGNTNLVDPEDITFEFPEAPSAGTVIPELYSLSTGEKIELVRGVWNYSDIANHLVACSAGARMEMSM